MCQYSSENGLANDWHFVHLGSRAVGGAGLVMAEATAVTPQGRISPEDLGLWQDSHIEPLARITRFVREQGAVPAIQLAHAGRKAGMYRPWAEQQGVVGNSAGGWRAVAPSPVAYADGYPMPTELGDGEIGEVIEAFRSADRSVGWLLRQSDSDPSPRGGCR